MSRVVLIVLDSLRADAVDWDDPEGATPNLAALARRGVVFERAVAPAAWTLPSHVSMLSGQMPTEHRFQASGSAKESMTRARDRFSDPSCPDWFLPAWLGARDVSTYLGSANVWVSPLSGIGRWFGHVDYVPFPHGRRVDELPAVHVGPRQQAPPRLPPTLRRAVPLPIKHVGRFAAEGLLRVRNSAKQARPLARWALSRGDKGGAAVVDGFERWLTIAPNDFFAFFNLIETHEPHLSPRGFGPADAAAFMSMLRHPGQMWARRMNLHNWGYRSLPKKTLLRLRQAYANEVRYADHCVGGLIETLRHRGELEDTTVIVTSDHGEAFDEAGLVGHGLSLGDAVARVPLVVAGGGLDAGRVREPVSLASLAATVANLLTGSQGPFPHPELLSTSGQGRAEIEVEAPWVHFHASRGLRAGRSPEGMESPAAAFYWGQMKLIVGSFWGEALFDLDSDPEERHNLIGSVACPPELVAMRAAWRSRVESISR